MTSAEVTAAADPPPVHLPDADPGRQRARSRRQRCSLEALLSAAGVVAALVPIVVAVARAVADGWLPVGDNALYGIRARDVFTANPPLLGLWTSASLTAGIDVSSPGPLLFDFLAVPATIWDRGTGLAVGTAVLNGASVVGIVAFAHRRGSAPLAALAALVTALLCWSMGSELLFDPWQPHVLLLPFLFLLVLVWSVTLGDLAAVPWSLVVASLIGQTHLSYAILLGLLAVVALGGLGLELRRRRRADPAARPGLRRRTWRVGMLGGAVLAVLWAQPLAEQIAGGSDGNLARLVESAGAVDDETYGAETAARMVGELALPPFWLRPSFGDAWGGEDASFEQLPGLAEAVAGVAGVVAVGGLAVVVAQRGRHRVEGLAVAVASVAFVGSFLTVTRSPATPFAEVAPHQFRFLWPVAAFATFAVAAVAIRVLLDRQLPSRRLRRVVAGALVVATVTVAAINLPAHNAESGPAADDYAIGVVRDLNRQLVELDVDGPLLADDLHGLVFDPYGTAILAELQREGVEFVVDSPGMVRQLGPSRELQGDAVARIFYDTGPDAGATPPGARRVAFHEGLSPQEHEELDHLTSDVVRHLQTTGGPDLNAEGRAALGDDQFPVLGSQLDVPDGAALASSGELGALVRRDLIEVDDRWAPRYERFAELRLQRRETVAVFVEPL